MTRLPRPMRRKWRRMAERFSKCTVEFKFWVVFYVAMCQGVNGSSTIASIATVCGQGDRCYSSVESL